MDQVAFDTRVGAYVILVDQLERLLLTRWVAGACPAWTMPGGGVELDETPDEAAIREVKEEAGYVVELVRLLGLDSIAQPGEQRVPPQARALKSLRLIYEGRIVGGELRHEVDGSTDEARWVPIEHVAGMARVSLVDAALRLYRSTRNAG